VHGAYSENGALSQLGNKYFSEMYHSKIASDQYRAVLDTMASNHGDKWVSRKTIIEESRLSNTTVTNALTALKARGIILSDESRKNRGFYRLPTRSFAAWINALKSVEQQTGKEPGDDLP
jgi:Fe2+ or Zn2+ uptake regulation protein